MNRTITLGIAGAALFASACATNSRHTGLVNETSLVAESHTMWTRPTEVGYKMGGEISSSATANRVLGFNVGESKPPGVDVAAVLGPLLGGKGETSLSPVAAFAAYKAVTESRAEGIYITRIETEGSGFLFFYNTQTVTVYGRALTLENLGPIDQERADRWRYRRYSPNLVIVKDGDADIDLPVNVR